MQDIAYIIESLLFVADEPLSLDKLKSILETVESKEIKTALQSLADHYESRGGGFSLCEVAGGWQFRSRPEYNPWIKRLLQPSPQRLSKPALETLAIVAYNQPIIRADIEHIRGVDCGGVLRQLMERKLIRVLGRKEIPGRPLIYATTKLFLEIFGLKDLRDLPSPKEIEEMATAMEAGKPDASTEAGMVEPSMESKDLYEEWDTSDASATPGMASQLIEAVHRVHSWLMRGASKAIKGGKLPSAVHLKPKPLINYPPHRIASPPASIPAANSMIKICWRPHAILSGEPKKTLTNKGTGHYKRQDCSRSGDYQMGG
jgi:segregation and condensation protein B